MARQEGVTIGPYRVVEQVGLGGMATVYKAYQPSMERYVALKILPQHYARDASFVQRFIREARTIANLEHRNILPVYDFGEQDGVTYLAMRFLEGGTLKDILRLGRLTLSDASELLSQIAAALDYAHRQGVIHRDVKPANIMVDNEGWAYLTDFGIAKALEGTSDLTQGAIGTPAYMAPEQSMGQGVDARTDIYALGIILYEMVTGRVPYEADTPMAVALAHVHSPLPLPREIDPNIPEPIEQVILKAVAKEPADRYQTAGEFASALREAITEAGVDASQTHIRALANKARESFVSQSQQITQDDFAPIHPPTQPAPEPGRPKRWPFVVGILAAVVIIGGIIAALFLTGVLSIGQPSREAAQELEQTPVIEAAAPTNIISDTEVDSKPTPVPTAAPTTTPSEYVEGEVLFEDNFEDGSNDGWSAIYGWTVIQDETGNFVLQGSGSDWNHTLAGSEDWTNYAFEVSVRVVEFVTPENNLGFGISFRDDSRRPNHDVYDWNLGRGFTSLGHNSINDWQDLTFTDFQLPIDTWMTVRVEMFNGLIRGYIDGQKILEITDSEPLLNGRIGFSHAPTNTVWFDNVRVIELIPASEAPTDGDILFRDDFDGTTLNDEWAWIREEAASWNLTDQPGSLTFMTSNTSMLFEGGDSPLLLHAAPEGNFELRVKLDFTPTQDYQAVYITIYQDDDNFVGLARAYCSPSDTCFGDGAYLDNDQQLISQGFFTNSAGGLPEGPIYLRLVKKGTIYTGLWSANGEIWNLILETTASMTPTQVGIFTSNGRTGADSVPAVFDFFEIRKITE